MEDFEYSLEIADRDWECFLSECQECELLPPTLAVVDESGLSEFDSTEFTLAQTVQKADPTADFTEVDHPVDSPPDCGGFPLENYLSKHDIIETDSVLSGSEEDLHLQCVNIFCEQLKNSTEAERFTEPIQERAGRSREAIKVEEHFGDGEQVSCIPVLNCLPANGLITDGKESSDPTDTISHENNQMKKDGSGSNSSPEPTVFNSLQTNKLSHPETKSIITSVANTEPTVSGATVSQDPPDEVETTPHNEIVLNLHLDVVEHENLLRNKLNVHKKPSSDYLSNLEILKNVKWNENLNVSQLHATNTTQSTSPCQSPSVSLKRKNRKKRRLGAEPAENGHGYERGGLMKSSDSEEEQYRQRGRKGLCVSEDVRLFYLNDQLRQCVSSSTAYSESRHVPLKVATEEIKGNNLFLSEPACERKVRQEICGATGSPKDTATDSSGHVATSWQTDSKCLEGETNVLNKSLELPLSISVSITGKSELTKETEKPGRNDTPAGSLSQSGKTNHSVIRSENKQLSAVEVKSPTHSILSAESYDPTVEPGQCIKLYAEKSVLAEDAGNPGRDMNTRQAEKDHYTDQHRSPPEKTDFPLRANSMSGVQNTKVNHRKITACTFPEVSTLLDGAKPAFDNINLRSDKFCPYSLDVQTVQQTEEPAARHTLSILDVSKKAKRQELASSQTTAVDNRSSSDVSEINLTVASQREAKASISEDLLTNPSEGSPEFSCCTVDTPPATMRPCENVTLWIVTKNDSSGQRGKNPPIKHVQARSQSVSDDITDSKRDLTPETTAAPKAEWEPSFFAMSSFWSEMEKVTINDILALRKTGAAAPPSCIPPSEEDEQTDVLMDSEPITQPAESNPKVSVEYTCSDANSETCSSPVSSKGVLWESERVPVGPDADADTEDVMLSPVRDISQLVLPRGNQKQLKGICKSVSMRNLHVPVNSTDKPSNTLDKGELEEVIYSPDGHMNKQEKNIDCLASSATDSYRISLTDIFNYLFAGKQTKPSPSAKENTSYCYTHGNSVSETYDYFFSEFNIESFFSPMIEADQGRDRLVFSSSHSDKRNLQFPEAYDHFFASSSSDDSSEECDEDEHRPVRVVNRFSRKSSTSNISRDIYEDFFTDSDLRQNFFWTNTLSFRKMNFIGSTVKTQSLSNLVGRSIKRMVIPANALGNQDVMFPDPLLHHLEDRISRQLDQQPFRYEDLETAISNPSLDIPLLPLRQSDMCLVCIVFASWVLKTANPQVGDAWKAVLLANVSALSSIRYLRKYINAEAAATERKLLFSTSSNS